MEKVEVTRETIKKAFDTLGIDIEKATPLKEVTDAGKSSQTTETSGWDAYMKERMEKGEVIKGEDEDYYKRIKKGDNDFDKDEKKDEYYKKMKKAIDVKDADDAGKTKNKIETSGWDAYMSGDEKKYSKGDKQSNGNYIMKELKKSQPTDLEKALEDAFRTSTDDNYIKLGREIVKAKANGTEVIKKSANEGTEEFEELLKAQADEFDKKAKAFGVVSKDLNEQVETLTEELTKANENYETLDERLEKIESQSNGHKSYLSKNYIQKAFSEDESTGKKVLSLVSHRKEIVDFLDNKAEIEKGERQEFYQDACMAYESSGTLPQKVIKDLDNNYDIKIVV